MSATPARLHARRMIARLMPSVVARCASARVRAYAVLLTTAVATACGPHGVAPLTGAEFTLQQAADSVPLAFRKDVKVGEVWMTFTGVSNDSRCPTGVKCVWEGDAVVELAVHPGCYKQGCRAASQQLSLHTTLDPKSGSGWGYRVTLLSLAPHPAHGTATDSSQYVAWVRVVP